MDVTLNNSTELDTLLTANGIDTETWGSGATKSVDHLWREIEQGESTIRLDPLRRVLSGVVQVIIRRQGLLLIDAEQILLNGQKRVRNIPPSEKMQPGESYAEAAIRGLQEELGVSAEHVVILAETHQEVHESRVSWSYPGLLTVYPVHKVEALVHGLPAYDFWTIEHPDSTDSTVGRHKWVWSRQHASVF